MFDKESWRELTRIYRKETSYLLNHYTLNIRKPSIAKERLRYNNTLLTKIYLPASIVLSALHFCFVLFYKLEADKLQTPWIISSTVDALFAISLYSSHRYKLYKMSVACFYLYYIFRALIVILSYTD